MNVVTGDERNSTDPKLNAVIDFYKAFNRGDMSSMEKNWAKDSSIVMSNPLGGIKKGWDEIKAVYKKIFNGPAKVYVEFYDFTLIPSAEMFTIIGRERGSFRTAKLKVNLEIRTSRVYQQVNGEWKQIHHHGSIENPELLLKYQTAVLKAYE